MKAQFVRDNDIKKTLKVGEYGLPRWNVYFDTNKLPETLGLTVSAIDKVSAQEKTTQHLANINLFYEITQVTLLDEMKDLYDEYAPGQYNYLNNSIQILQFQGEQIPGSVKKLTKKEYIKYAS